MDGERAEIEKTFAKAYATAPAFQDEYRRSVSTLVALVGLAFVAVVVVLALGLAWMFGWVELFSGYVLSAILGALAVAWLIAFARWRACKVVMAEIEAMRGRAVDEAAQLNERFATRHVEGDEPFALYLRSFSLEAVSGLGRAVGDPMSGRVLALHPPAEEGLAAALEGRIAGWALYNADTTGVGFRVGLPKLTLGQQWKSRVEGLIASASFIVVDATETTAGLVDELELIERHGRANRTVIITPCEADLQEIEGRDRLLAAQGLLVFARAERLSPEDLDRYGCIVGSDDIDYQHLDSLAEFAELLASPTTKGLDVLRRSWVGASKP